MAIVNFIKARGQTSGGMLGCINYCIQPSKTQLAEHRLVTGVNCVADTAFREFMNTKRLHSKTDGRLYYHLIQSFHPSENLTPQSYLAGEAADEEPYQNSVLDRNDPQPDFLAVGMDAAYLAADLSSIIEEDNYIDDCTTKHFRPERKKHNSPTMGGL